MNYRCFILVLLSFNYSLQAADYYISPTGDDMNSGSQGSPFLHIQKGLDVAIAGDTIFVEEGRFNEKLIWINSGSPGQLITLKNVPGASPVVDGTGIVGENMLWINSKSFLVVEGLTFIQNYINLAKGIYIVGEAEDITIRSCTLDSIGWSMMPCPSAGQAYGILVNGRTVNGIHNISILDNHIRNIHTGNSEALTVAGNVYDFLIARDTIHDTKNIGIDIAGHFTWAVDMGVPDSLNQGRNGIIKNCILYSNRRCDNVDAPAGIYTDGAKNIVIDGNTSYDNGNGLSIGCENAGKISENIIVVNNVVYDNDNNGIIYGSNVGLIKNCILKNNSFVENGKLGLGHAEVALQNSDSSNIIQNIIIPRTTSDFAVSIFSYTASNLIVDRNLAYRYNMNASNLYVTDGQFTPMNSLNVDPLFVNYTLPSPDFNLLPNSPVIDSGSNQYGVVSILDYNKKERVVNGALDYGAIESPNGGCPTTLLIDNSKLLRGKFTASNSISFETAGNSAVLPVDIDVPNVTLDEVEFQSILTVSSEGCAN